MAKTQASGLTKHTAISDVKGVAKPLVRALDAEGYATLESLHGKGYHELLSLHGVGKTGLQRLQDALEGQGLSMKNVASQVTMTQPSILRDHTGTTASDVKTHVTSIRPADYIAGLDTARRVEHGQLLLRLFSDITHEDAVMWGPTMIGYGQTHYASASGREGDWFALGFSPRKAKISLYGVHTYQGAEQEMARLGKFTTGAGCLYINKPEDISWDVLTTMIEKSWQEYLELPAV